jgi:hypothetical protein
MEASRGEQATRCTMISQHCSTNKATIHDCLREVKTPCNPKRRRENHISKCHEPRWLEVPLTLSIPLVGRFFYHILADSTQLKPPSSSSEVPLEEEDEDTFFSNSDVCTEVETEEPAIVTLM